MNDVDQKSISASLLRLRSNSAFFATLALHAQFHPTQSIDTAATDGKDIFFNPEYLRSLPPAQQDGLLLHIVLHAALHHLSRRGIRDARRWNIAADIVVNGTVWQQGFELPPGELRVPHLEDFSVEEIYELLTNKECNCCGLATRDLIDNSPENCQDSLFQTRRAEIEAYWQIAYNRALTDSCSTERGKLPAGMKRELSLLTAPQIDWRSFLWRYLSKTPTDYVGYDRRFIGRGLYLESLEGESVQVYVAIDTSGSINNEQLRLFLSELQGILCAYPHISCDLYYADAEAYGPYPLDSKSIMPNPQGGGGTSFVPFFSKVQESWDGLTGGVCVYLTDGNGTFPERQPQLPVLWVVTPGGLDLSKFPFGETVRLLSV
ncbi:MAG: hypothetical protein CLLPBCKN_006756 [Chroococcidiopsis cubana SAG 39.79]|uniref:Hydrolase n=1 Tax=Chroococcidiopsis cubana SAG 39.79 TaxID=388085 RepID=A0AB37UCL6_9CYAN|nr:VWA-like domain-containing protein [Chroococcidiopsis cubana]MDZ4877321.1 hypothetical protein [Chroococcidiopsis cubana SAG 39.79]PSB56722.1 hypothetical protein C7B79_31850 [Chroococcidiopsis cubana CCALA 043]RUT05867.1 hydrolase [Chroococcidiopsis cubana SAG 39.79]